MWERTKNGVDIKKDDATQVPGLNAAPTSSGQNNTTPAVVTPAVVTPAVGTSPSVATWTPPISTTFSPSSSKTLTIYFNGGALKFEPSMLIPDAKSKDVFFNPTIKYNPKAVYDIPTGQNKQYRYNKFFSSVAFNDQIISATLRSFGGMQKPMTLEQATNARVIDYNIYVTLHALFSTNNVLYINKKPYTIYKFSWNEEWQLDTKLSSSTLRENNPFASESHIRFEKEEEEEAKKMLEEVPESARMSVKMKEHILKSEAAATESIEGPTVKTSIKAAATRTGVGTRQNLVNVVTPTTLKNTYKSPYYKILATENDKNPITIIRPLPDPFKTKEKTNGAIVSDDNDLASEALSFSIMKKLSGTSLLDIMKRTFSGAELTNVLENNESLNSVSEILYRTTNKFYDVHHPSMSSKLNEIDDPLEIFKSALNRRPEVPLVCHFEAEGAYFWKWISDVGNQEKIASFAGDTSDLDKMKEIVELGAKVTKNISEHLDLKQYLSNTDLIENLFSRTSASFQGKVKKVYDEIELPKIFADAKCAPTELTTPTTTPTTPTTTSTTTPAATTTPTITLKMFNQTHSAQLKLLRPLITILIEFVGLMQNCARTIISFIRNLELFFVSKKNILTSFLKKIQSDGNPFKDDVLKEILADSCKYDIQSCDTLIAQIKKWPEGFPFFQNVDLLRYDVSDPFLNENQFVKYYNNPDLIDVDFKTLFKYIFEAQLVFTGVNAVLFKTYNENSEIVHDRIKQVFVDTKRGYMNALGEYVDGFDESLRVAYESSLKLSEDQRRALSSDEPNENLIAAYQRKNIFAGRLQTIITVHPFLSYIHCLRIIRLKTVGRNEAMWRLSCIAVSEEFAGKPIDQSIHSASILQEDSGDSPSYKNDIMVILQDYNINNLRKGCSAIMKQTPASSCTELQLHVVKPFANCLVKRGYKQGTEKTLLRFYTFLKPEKLVGDNMFLQIVCDVLNAHLESVGASSTHDFYNKQTSAFQPETIKSMNAINLLDKLMQNVLIGLKINLITVSKDGAQDTYRVLHYVPANSSDVNSVDDSSSDASSESGINLGSVEFSDYIILLKNNETGDNFSVYVPVSNGSLISSVNMRSNYNLLMSDNAELTQSQFDKLFVSNAGAQKGGAATTTTTTTTVPTTTTTTTVPTTTTTTTVPTTTTTTTVPAKKSISSQIAAMKNIQKMANKESKLSYYIMVDLVLVPGDKISIMQMANMECKIKADNVQKSLSETFGFTYAPPPLFTDYETERHDSHGAARKNPFAIEQNDISKLIVQHEKELNAVLSDSYKKEQDLAMERAMQQLGKNYPTKRGLFS